MRNYLIVEFIQEWNTKNSDMICTVALNAFVKLSMVLFTVIVEVKSVTPRGDSSPQSSVKDIFIQEDRLYMNYIIENRTVR